MILLSTANESFAVDQSWYFTAGEIKIAYRYQQSFGRRLRHPLNPQACYFGKTEFTASFQGKTFLAPCRFIHRTTNHLKVMLENGAARYLFPLDADHAHLAIPIELWREKYSRADGAQLLPQILHEPALVAFYHTAEHLSITDSTGSPIATQIKQWKAKRNVLGFYDGHPVRILPPLPDGAADERLDSYQVVAGFFFLAHRLAEITISASGKSHSFDLSFDDDMAEKPSKATTPPSH